MTTPETRARLGALEQQLADPTPVPLDGQTSLTLDWVCPHYDQEPLWPTPSSASSSPTSIPPRSTTTPPASPSTDARSASAVQDAAIRRDRTAV
ncbi:hypothetical protein ACFCWY_33650 [Streptomyces sp. NPDC056362]|uniref:hypothetical protein n=1 Tax=unclassified Streptomyces TaxID=2593676 RepID=UPI0035DCBE55